MSYYSRLYRHRNPSTHDEGSRESFFSKHNDINRSGQKAAFFQAKLSVNEPGDKYEREADSVANAVVDRSAKMPLQRKEAMPEKEKKKKITPVQTKPEGGVATASRQVSSRIENSSGKGNPLPQKTLHEMNSSFGVDFSNVYIHNDSEAINLNSELQAQAFTHGRDIYFNEGKYNPESSEGKFLLAHELTHVAQQTQLNSLHKKDGDSKPKTEKKYNILIEKGDKDWSASELELLYAALRSLSTDEATVLRNYRFIRWSSKASRAKSDPSYVDPGVDECGLHEADLKNGIFKISLYDACFDDPQAVSDKTAGIDTGEFHILHEIGHAMQQAELRNTNEAQQVANKKYNEAVDKYNKAGTTDQRRMKPAMDRLDKASEKAVKEMRNSEGRSLKDFEKLIEGKGPLTEYSKTSVEEAFAEAFAVFKADPQGLKTNNRKLFDWFAHGGVLKSLKKK